MRKVVFIIACLISQFPVFAQSGEQKDVLSIQDAMSIVSHRRSHPLVNHEELYDFVMSIINKYSYKEGDFIEGAGTCGFWQYIKYGHIINEEPLDDDYFVPDNKRFASAIAITDCSGIETIEDDETAISAEIRVFTEARRDELLKEMQDIGFAYSKTEYYGKVYTWKSYAVSLFEGKSRGHKYWRFTVGVEALDFGSTKVFEYADSSSVHNVKIKVDYPINGNPVLLRRVRTFIMETLESDLQNDGPLMGRFNGDPSDGQAVINYYGRKGSTILKDKHESGAPAFDENTIIKKVAENDYFISFEVYRTGWYGGLTSGSVHELRYGMTFRKSDGKRLRVIANPQNSQFKDFISNQIYIDDQGRRYEEYNNNIPFPEYEPFLIQSGVRFIFQKNEIAPCSCVGDVSFSEIRQFLSDEARNAICGTIFNSMVNENRELNVVKQRLSAILSAIVAPYVEDKDLNKYFTKRYTANRIRECQNAEINSQERPRIWWQESESDPDSFKINEVLLKTKEEASSNVVISGEAPEGVTSANYNVTLKKEDGIWLIDKIIEID